MLLGGGRAWRHNRRLLVDSQGPMQCVRRVVKCAGDWRPLSGLDQEVGDVHGQAAGLIAAGVDRTTRGWLLCMRAWCCNLGWEVEV